MKPWVKTMIGILSHIPALWMVTFFCIILFLITHGPGSKANSEGVPLFFILFFLCHMLVILLIFLLMAFWVIWLIKGSDLPQEAKILWGIGAFFAGPIIMPILFWLYLRKIPDGPYLFGVPLS